MTVVMKIPSSIKNKTNVVLVAVIFLVIDIVIDIVKDIVIVIVHMYNNRAK